MTIPLLGTALAILRSGLRLQMCLCRHCQSACSVTMACVTVQHLMLPMQTALPSKSREKLVQQSAREAASFGR